jgi:hypothetical protein
MTSRKRPLEIEFRCIDAMACICGSITWFSMSHGTMAKAAARAGFGLTRQ